MVNFVYRALSETDIENFKNGKTEILHKEKIGKGKEINDLFEFIEKGSKFGTKFISTTRCIGIACVKYATGPEKEKRRERNPIVLVDLDKLGDNVVLHDMEKFIQEGNKITPTAKKYALADREVIIEDKIPRNAFKVIHPLLVDVLYGMEIAGAGTQYYNNALNKRIINDNQQKLIEKLFKNVKINKFERDFIESYYGIVINKDKISVDNPDKNLKQLKKDNLPEAVKEICEKYKISENEIRRNFIDFKNCDNIEDCYECFGSCIITQIIRNMLEKNLKILDNEIKTSKENKSFTPKKLDEKMKLEKNWIITGKKLVGFIRGCTATSKVKKISSYTERQNTGYVFKNSHLKLTVKNQESYAAPYGVNYYEDGKLVLLICEICKDKYRSRNHIIMEAPSELNPIITIQESTMDKILEVSLCSGVGFSDVKNAERESKIRKNPYSKNQKR